MDPIVKITEEDGDILKFTISNTNVSLKKQSSFPIVPAGLFDSTGLPHQTQHVCNHINDDTILTQNVNIM